MELGYEERSQKLIERLDRIQNYLNSLPPLPKIGSTLEAVKEQSKELSEVLSSASSQLNDVSADSVGSSSIQGSVSTKPSRAIPKDSDGQQFQQIPSPEISTSSHSSFAGEAAAGSPMESGRLPRPSPPVPEIYRKRKKKRRDNTKIQDPLRPTERRSFGVDIGQGMNVINYIKQNALPGSGNRSDRLTNIITRDVPILSHTDRSLSRVFRQGPLADSSFPSSQCTNRVSDGSTTRSMRSKQKEASFSRILNITESEDMKYRVRIVEKPVELPHYHGLDALQELFVPYMEHDTDTETEPCRNTSEVE